MSDLLLRLESLAGELPQRTETAIVLTLAAYFAGLRLFAWLHSPAWCPPILLASCLLALWLALLPLDYAGYRQGVEWLTWLLGPATVALGVPLYQQVHHIRALWKPIALTLPPAAMLAAGYAVGIAWLLDAPPRILASLAPKSVTAPIAMGITQELGGSVSLLMGALLITGVMATLGITFMARGWRLEDERVIGFALGVNGHAIGTVRAFEIGPTAGAFASLGMSLTGVFTALWLPLMWHLMA